MRKIFNIILFIFLIWVVLGCPKEADIEFKETVDFIPKDISCLTQTISEVEGVVITDSRILNLNSPFNGYTIYFNTDHSSTDLTIYEPESNKYVYILSSWIRHDATDQQIKNTKTILSNIFSLVKRRCLLEASTANKSVELT